MPTKRNNRSFRVLVLACGALLLASAARADRVIMNDGSIREGTVLSHDDKVLLLRSGGEGFRITVSIPMSDISHVIITHDRPTLAAPTTANAAVNPDKPLTSDHFFREWLLMGLGSAAGNFDPEHLSAAQQMLWSKSIQDEQNGDKPAELAVLTSLVTAPNADIRLLNKFSTRQHGEVFGVWLGRLRWSQVRGENHLGQFDLSAVTPIEVPTLIGLLRAATPDALAPLVKYYPLSPAQAELPKAMRPPDPLAGITALNGAAIKEQAYYAAAVLSGQLNLEPDMQELDKSVLLRQLGNAHAIIARCAELDPEIRAAAEKAAREQKLQQMRAGN